MLANRSPSPARSSNVLVIGRLRALSCEVQTTQQSKQESPHDLLSLMALTAFGSGRETWPH